MTHRCSRFFVASGQNAVPFSGWFCGGWSPATTLAIFWFENLPRTAGPKDETFEQYWERIDREEAARSARDEEIDEVAGA